MRGFVCKSLMGSLKHIHTDIRKWKWQKALPAFVQPYIYLARLDRPIGIWLLLLPAWWSIVLASGGVMAMNARDWKVFALFALGAVVMRAAGCVVNDIWDRKLDQRVERTALRPLAAGDVKIWQALVFLVVLLFIGLWVLVQMNIVTILLGILSVPLIAIYPLMKRITWWPQAFLGLVFNFGALMGWSAITATVQIPALILYAAAILWTLGYDTVYAHQDKEDDALVGIKSTALKFAEHSTRWVHGFYTGSWVLIAVALIMVQGVWASLFLLPAAGYAAWQLRHWQSDDAASALAVFQSSRNYGLLILLACAL